MGIILQEKGKIIICGNINMIKITGQEIWPYARYLAKQLNIFYENFSKTIIDALSMRYSFLREKE